MKVGGLVDSVGWLSIGQVGLSIRQVGSCCPSGMTRLETQMNIQGEYWAGGGWLSQGG